MIEQFAVLCASFLANILTAVMKPRKDVTVMLTQEQIDARRTFIRLLNLVFGIVVVISASYLLGEPLDMTTINGSLEAIMNIALTFGMSQGMYLLKSK